MPTTAKLYIGCVIALGLGLLGLSLFWGWGTSDAGRYAAYLALAAICSTWKVKLPGMQGTMSVNFLFILLGVAELGLAETLVLGCAATLVQCVWKAKKVRFVQVFFNVAAMVIGAFACYTIAHALTQNAFEPAPLAVAAAVFFICNTASVSFVLALLNQKPFLELWRNCHLWTFPYYLTGAAVAAIISGAGRTMGWKVSLLPLVMMYLVYTYYRMYVSQRGEVQTLSAT